MSKISPKCFKLQTKIQNNSHINNPDSKRNNNTLIQPTRSKMAIGDWVRFDTIWFA